MTAIFIALLHAVPVVIAGLLFSSINLLKFVALIAAFVGVVAGNEIYMLLDAFVVFFSYHIMREQIENRCSTDSQLNQEYYQIISASDDSHRTKKQNTEPSPDRDGMGNFLFISFFWVAVLNSTHLYFINPQIQLISA